MLTKAMKEKAFEKALTNLTSVKYHVLIISSVFFAVKILSETGWITVVLGTLGYNAANEIGALMKGKKK